MQSAVYLVNLDRRADRLAEMRAQLDRIGLTGWTRIPALDARAVPAGRVHPRVADRGHRVRMGRGSQCYAASFLAALEIFLADGRDSAIFLQDDVRLSPALAPMARDASFVPEGIGLVQLEQFGSGQGKVLLGPELARAPFDPQRKLHRLHSRRAGAACFWLRREAARAILEGDFEIDMPTDHLLFSPNVSPVFDRLDVALMTPAMARQDMAGTASDLSAERRRKKHPVERLRRLHHEINLLPRQAALSLTGRASWQRPELQL
ncbi:hypothetical protein [Limimaricola pyoseonensis]|uniref:Glycosyltransferase involved in LPS biosynthesis, GR25 family n=1 Tax=Limimaricola pyoseonensis TaxID=521013 RepID=A0A1G7D1S3_9RHOB|nr:hypothetical protein [Limimaricola pyoseonensis]SDE44866.1 Glycosyltransferase involved in LPS biosynthesis, GR25 family [Limimaricola pyoseonensis]